MAFGCEEGRDERWSKERSCAGFHCTQLQPRVETLHLVRAKKRVRKDSRRVEVKRKHLGGGGKREELYI
jgi:hypothetical protein